MCTTEQQEGLEPYESPACIRGGSCRVRTLSLRTPPNMTYILERNTRRTAAWPTHDKARPGLHTGTAVSCVQIAGVLCLAYVDGHVSRSWRSEPLPTPASAVRGMNRGHMCFRRVCAGYARRPLLLQNTVHRLCYSVLVTAVLARWYHVHVTRASVFYVSATILSAPQSHAVTV